MFNIVGSIVHHQSDTLGPGLEPLFTVTEFQVAAGPALTIERNRDHIPVPLNSRGLVRCDLRFQGSNERLVARGEAIRLALRDVPKYIEHLRPLTPKL